MTTNKEALTVMRLRVETHAGLLDCKHALKRCGWDYELAKDYLRQRGNAVVRFRIKKNGKREQIGFEEWFFEILHKGRKPH